jgi:hypothetical protein
MEAKITKKPPQSIRFEPRNTFYLERQDALATMRALEAESLPSLPKLRKEAEGGCPVGFRSWKA